MNKAHSWLQLFHYLDFSSKTPIDPPTWNHTSLNPPWMFLSFKEHSCADQRFLLWLNTTQGKISLKFFSMYWKGLFYSIRAFQVVVKNTPSNAGGARDAGLIPWSGRSPGKGNGNPLQYSCLGNPIDRGAWWATVHGAAKNWNQLSILYYHA